MPLNLTLPALRAAYTEGSETPATLMAKLRAQAVEQYEYNAWIHVLTEEELQPYIDALAEKPIESLPLWGVPFAIKDNIDLKGIPTTAGCEAFTYTPTASATAVEHLIAAGALPLGKTNLDQFATGLVGARSPWGEGKNVFNTDYVSGGSSAGSAIATALGQVSFALGTDTAGSGRVPTAFNNLIGHKPTRGLISCSGVVPACKTLDCVTVMALTTADTVAVLEVAAQEDQRDPYSRQNTCFNTQFYWTDEQPAAFRFGVPSTLDFDGDDACAALFEAGCSHLEKLGGRRIDIDFAPFLKTAALLYEGPWVAERAWATRDVARTDMLPVISEVLATTDRFDVTDAFAAQYALQALKRECDQSLASVDVMVTPTTPTCYRRDALAEQPVALNSKLGTYTNFMNLLDYAATAVPVGQLPSAVSWGITLFSHAFTDIRLLSLAGALQRSLSLPLGATEHRLTSPVTPGRQQPAEWVDVVVCGAHLEGQPLNWQLTDRGGQLKARTETTPEYALYALPDGRRPALVPRPNGAAIEVEVWAMPMSAFGSFVAGIPSPLGIGKVTLASGEVVSGFICEEGGLENAVDISEFGGWRAYLSTRAA